MPYRDMLLPHRPEQETTEVPKGFNLRLRFVAENPRLLLEARIYREPLRYLRRGYFRPLSMTPSAVTFRVPIVGLLDPFLTGNTVIQPPHFPILLRVILPKLQKNGIDIQSNLSIAETLPLRIHAEYLPDWDKISVKLSQVIDRTMLKSCPGLTGYMLYRQILYHITPEQLESMRSYEESFLRKPENVDDLIRMYDKWPELFVSLEAMRKIKALSVERKVQIARLSRLNSGRQSAPVSAPVNDLLYPPFSSTTSPSAALKEKGHPLQLDFTAMEEQLHDSIAQIAADKGITHRDFFSYRRTTEKLMEKIDLSGSLLESAELYRKSDNTDRSFVTAQFLSYAERLRDYTIKNARFVPYHTGRPTYQDMTALQRSWYFYWRHRFREGELLKTDLGYLYIHVYELLNGIPQGGDRALSELLRLWEGYRKDYHSLDLLMPNWCVSYMLINHLGTDFDSIHERIGFNLTECGLPAEIFFSQRFSKGLSHLSLSLLAELSRSNTMSSRYLQEEMHRQAMEETVQQVLETVEQVYAAREQNLLGSCLARKKTHLMESYTGAILDRTQIRLIRLQYYPLLESGEFQKLISGILRVCENALRRRDHFPGRLKVDVLPPLVTDTITPLLNRISQGDSERRLIDNKLSIVTPATPEKPLVIDISRARKLEAESWENTRRLLEALGEEVPDVAKQEKTVASIYGSGETELSSKQPAYADSPPSPSDTINDNTVPCSAGTAPTTDAQLFREKLSRTAKAVLRSLIGGDLAAVREICTAQMTFSETIYEEINETALEIVGDLLLDTVTGEVYEDYRELVQSIVM